MEFSKWLDLQEDYRYMSDLPRLLKRWKYENERT